TLRAPGLGVVHLEKQAGAAEVGQYIRITSTQAIAPWVMQRLASGETVAFDPFKVRSDGVLYRGQIARWNGLRAPRLQDGQLRLERGGDSGWAHVSVSRVNHFDAFMVVLERHLQARS